MKVEVRNNDVVRAYKKIKRKLTDDGVFDELKERQYWKILFRINERKKLELLS